MLLYQPSPGLAQGASLWLDGGAIYARPPGGIQTPAGDYATGNALLRITASRLLTAESSGFIGSGLGSAAEAWLGGDAGIRIARPDGLVRPELDLDGAGLWYHQPFDYSALTATARPGLIFGPGAWSIGLAGELARGHWTGTATTTSQSGPPPFRGPPTQETVEGRLAVTGATVTLTRTLGAVTAGLEGQWLQATNGQAPGHYAGVQASVSYAPGRWSAYADAAGWRVPGDDGAPGSDLGFDVGASVLLSRAVTAHLALDRSVRDPLYGSPGSLGARLGITWRLRLAGAVGLTPAPPAPVAQIGERLRDRRRVRFRLLAPGARGVALAGDFDGWQPQPMHRRGAVWTLDMVLPPGLYHFAFRVDGQRWLVPDDAPGIADDGWGRRTASIVVPGAL
jgi:Glycogen recognition site of AMP-activated protein kinase